MRNKILLSTFLLGILASSMEAAEPKAKTSKEEIANLTNSINIAKNNIPKLENQLASANRTIRENENKIVSARQIVSKDRSNLKIKDNEITTLNNNINNAQADLKIFNKKILTLENENKEISEVIGAIEENQEKIKAEMKILTENLEIQKIFQEKKVATIKKIEDVLAPYRAHLEENNIELTKLKNNKQDLEKIDTNKMGEKEHGEIQTKIVNTREKIKQVEAEIDKLNRKLNVNKKPQEDREKELNLINKEIVSINTSIVTKNDKTKKLEAIKIQLQEKSNNLIKDIETNKTDVKNSNSQIANLTKQLSEANTSKKLLEDALKASELAFNTINSTSNKIIAENLKSKASLEELIKKNKTLLLESNQKLQIAKQIRVQKALKENNVTDVFDSILSAGELNKLPKDYLDSDKDLQELIAQLKDIKSNSPYSYSLKATRDSLKAFEDNMGYLTVRPKEKQWIGQGKVISSSIKKGNKQQLKDEEGSLTSSKNYKTSSNSNGAIGTFEYGLDNNTSIGFAIGGNNQSTNFKGSSSLKGTSMYLGTYLRKDIKDFKLKTGLGYQLTDVKAKRNEINAKYHQNSYDIFTEGRYVVSMKDNLTIEPKIKLSYFSINQDKVKEGYDPNKLTMGTNKATQNTGDILIGIDFIKHNDISLGKINTILTLGVSNTLGNRNQQLTGYINGRDGRKGKNFKLDATEIPRTSGVAGLNIELEEKSGFIYNVGVDFQFADDYNRNVQLNLGIGYKF